MSSYCLLGDTTEAGGTAVIESSLEEWRPKAVADFEGKTLAQAFPLLSAAVQNAWMFSKNCTRVGAAGFTSELARKWVDSFYKMEAYMETYMGKYGLTSIENTLDPAWWNEIKTRYQETLHNAESMKGWSTEAADIELYKTRKMDEALKRGDLSDPIFDDEARAYFQDQARTGKLLQYTTVSPAALRAISDYKPAPALGGMGALFGALAAGAAAFLLMR